MRRPMQRWAIAGLMVCSGASPLFSEDSDPADLAARVLIEDPGDLADKPLDIVSGGIETRKNVAAAVFVVTAADIRRSGVTSIAEALRMVPGLHVGRMSNGQWAISARGFNNTFANKLLVLIDGRTVYTPLFGGVYWDVADVPLHEIYQIEVIRGPGGTLWGENAVNGVINIKTRSARPQNEMTDAGFNKDGGCLEPEFCGYLSAGGGTEERAFGAFGLGDSSGGFHYRVFGRYRQRDAMYLEEAPANDESRFGQVGFRADWGAVGTNEFRISANYYNHGVGQTFLNRAGLQPVDVDHTGIHGMFEWNHAVKDWSHLKTLFYYDQYRRTDTQTEFRRTYNLGLQHEYRFGETNILNYGGEIRFTSDDVTTSNPRIVYDPQERDLRFFSVFFQDQLKLADQRLHLTVGSKFSHNDYTQWEIQPNLRIAWVGMSRSRFWGAISRAVRIPTRAQEDVVRPFLTEREELPAEELLATEAGYRFTLPKMFLEVATFYNQYDDLIILVDGEEGLLPAKTWGVELNVNWKLAQWVELAAGYSFLEMDSADFTEGSNPEQIASLRSMMTFKRRFDVDVWLRYVSAAPQRLTDAYTELDIHLAWHLPHGLELALVGQNLLHDHHREFMGVQLNQGGILSEEVERGVYSTLTWRF